MSETLYMSISTQNVACSLRERERERGTHKPIATTEAIEDSSMWKASLISGFLNKSGLRTISLYLYLLFIYNHGPMHTLYMSISTQNVACSLREREREVHTSQ